MRILHLVSAATMTGPADPALGLARTQFVELDHQVALGIDSVREGNMAQKVSKAGLPLVEGLQLNTKGGLCPALADRKLLNQLQKDFDLVHVHTSHDHAVASLAKLKIPLVRTIHHGRGAQKRGLQGYAYRRTQAFFVGSEAHKSTLLNSYRFLRDTQVEVVPGAIDPHRFRPANDLHDCRKKFGLDKGAVVLGMVARIKPGRGHDLLLEAMERVLKELRGRTQVQLLLVGKGEGEAAVKAEIARRQLEHFVVMCGFRDQDLPQAYRAMDASILLEEGNDAGCRAVLESLACEIPVIGAEHPAIIEALQGAQAGVLIPPRNSEALAGALMEMINASSSMRRAWGQNGRRRIMERHTDLGRAKQVEQVYQRLFDSEPEL